MSGEELLRPRVLHVEDSAMDATLITRLLRKDGLDCVIHRVFERNALVRALESEPFDLILCDFSMPAFTGLEALKLAKSLRPEIPFVFVSAMIGEEAAVESLHMGAADYVLKDRLGRLPAAIRRALKDAAARREREMAMRRIEEQAMLLEKSSDAIIVTTISLDVTYANDSARKLYWNDREDVTGSNLRTALFSDDPHRFDQALSSLRDRGAWTGQWRIPTEGTDRFIMSHWTRVRASDGAPERILIFDSDVTEEKALEANLLRAQRLESIGALAAGVAHDVNNSLAPIVMGVDLLRALTREPESLRCLEVMSESAVHCTHLVGQIVTFARGTQHDRVLVPMRTLLEDLMKALKQVFPKNIRLTYSIPGDLWNAMGDATKLHQVFMNLAVNARDAMAQGGTFQLTASNIPPQSGAEAQQPTIAIEVQDSGPGVSPENAEKIFQPFFTTKTGQGGTGLGLALVQKIVHEHSGTIDLRSPPGGGAAFRVILPASVRVEPPAVPESSGPIEGGHGELILLVEDEVSLREMVGRLLEDAGFRVISTADGACGVSEFFRNQDDVALIVTDSSMPFLDGQQLIRLIHTTHPRVPYLLCSGLVHIDDSTLPSFEDRGSLLPKPFTAEQLLRAVHKAIEKRPRATA